MSGFLTILRLGIFEISRTGEISRFQFWLRKLHIPYLPGVTKRSSDQYFEKKIFLKTVIDPFHEK